MIGHGSWPRGETCWFAGVTREVVDHGDDWIKVGVKWYRGESKRGGEERNLAVWALPSFVVCSALLTSVLSKVFASDHHDTCSCSSS